jgi:hypothetical protein
MDDRYLTTTELEERLAAESNARARHRERQQIARYGQCRHCGAARTADHDRSNPGEPKMKLVCTADPAHSQDL